MIIPTRLIVLFSLPFLSACSTYEESFDCPVGEGVPCASLSTINNKINNGDIQVEELPENPSSSYLGRDFLLGLRG